MGRGDPGFQGGMWDLGFPGMFGIPVFKGRDGAGIGARIPRNVGLEFSGMGGDPEFPGNVGSRIPGNVWDLDFQGKGWSWDWRIPRNEGLEFLGNVRSGIPREYLGSWFSREGKREFPGTWDPEFLEIGDLEFQRVWAIPIFRRKYGIQNSWEVGRSLFSGGNVWDPGFPGSRNSHLSSCVQCPHSWRFSRCS